MKTLNVAAAAAVAGWYVLHGSARQTQTARPDFRRPSLFLVGRDHVEVGSSLRSAAALGFRDILLDDRGAGWFAGTAAHRREARAAARRHKNPLRVHRASADDLERFEEVVIVLPSGPANPLPQSKCNTSCKKLPKPRFSAVMAHAGRLVRTFPAPVFLPKPAPCLAKKAVKWLTNLTRLLQGRTKIATDQLLFSRKTF